MVRTQSTMLNLGTISPDFTLMSTEGVKVSLSDFQSYGLVVIFMCNHCPYVKHLADHLSKFADEFKAKGISFVGISSNDVENYPDDSFEKMKEEVALRGYKFPYLFDETQEVAKSYKAACTPDFFLFDSNKRLFYRGQYDASRPREDLGIPITGDDLRSAIQDLLDGKEPPAEQKPSLGCNIKWKPGNEPNYFSA